MTLENGTEFCIICKEIADGTCKIQVTNGDDKTAIEGAVCSHCWDRFVNSYHNKGKFKIAQFIGWAKDRKDFFRF